MTSVRAGDRFKGGLLVVPISDITQVIVSSGVKVDNKNGVDAMEKLVGYLTPDELDDLRYRIIDKAMFDAEIRRVCE